MPNASEVKKGHVIMLDGGIYIVKNVDVKSPSSRGANTLYKMRLNQFKTGVKRDESFTGDVFLPDVDLVRRPGQFLFREGDAYTFMDLEDYNQYTLDGDDISEDIIPFLTDGLEGLLLLLVDGEMLGVQLPASVVMEVMDTVPALKGGTAASRTKPASLVTGLVVQVPEYIAAGELIKINTETGKFMSRA